MWNSCSMSSFIMYVEKLVQVQSSKHIITKIITRRRREASEMFAICKLHFDSISLSLNLTFLRLYCFNWLITYIIIIIKILTRHKIINCLEGNVKFDLFHTEMID